MHGNELEDADGNEDDERIDENTVPDVNGVTTNGGQETNLTPAVSTVTLQPEAQVVPTSIAVAEDASISGTSRASTITAGSSEKSGKRTRDDDTVENVRSFLNEKLFKTSKMISKADDLGFGGDIGKRFLDHCGFAKRDATFQDTYWRQSLPLLISSVNTKRNNMNRVIDDAFIGM